MTSCFQPTLAIFTTPEFFRKRRLFLLRATCGRSRKHVSSEAGRGPNVADRQQYQDDTRWRYSRPAQHTARESFPSCKKSCRSPTSDSFRISSTLQRNRLLRPATNLYRSIQPFELSVLRRAALQHAAYAVLRKNQSAA